MHKFSFLELQKTLFLNKAEIPKTFGDVEIDASRFPDGNTTEFEEQLPKDFTPDLIQYINDKTMELERNYMANGLSAEEVELRKKTYGPNCLPEKKKTPGIVLFIEEITSTFSILLWIAAALSFLAYGLDQNEKSNLYLAVVVIVIILLSGFFSYIQNAKSGEIMDSFKSFSNVQVTVTRNGQKENISAKEIVKGDVVHIKTGEKIPADFRVFNIEGDLQLDNSPLTGESIACSAAIECCHKGKYNA